MARHGAAPATNLQIVRLLEEVKAELAGCRQRDQQIAEDLARLLGKS
jgi:hypothetical protein